MPRAARVFISYAHRKYFALHTYRQKMDDHRRIVLPVELLRKLTDAPCLYLTMGLKWIDAYTPDLWCELMEWIGACNAQSDESLRRLQRLLAANAHAAEPYPGSHRLLIPEHLAAHAQLGTHVVVTCLGRRIRFVSAETWAGLLKEPQALEYRKLIEWPHFLTDLPSACPDTQAAERIERYFHDLSPQAVLRMTSRDFEIAVGEVLARSGVGVVEVTQATRDQGVDVIVYIPCKPEPAILYVQCKKEGRRATARELRELIGVVARDGASAGLLVSTGEFTQQCKQEAHLSRIRVELVSAFRLVEWVETRLKSRSLLYGNSLGSPQGPHA